MKRKVLPTSLDRNIARLVGFVRFTNEFRRVRRLIWFREMKLEDPERNGEHSYQLALVAWYIRENYAPHLDLQKVLLYCLVHDLPETYAGDTPAFPDTSGRFKSVSRATKRRREQKALERIKREWGSDFPEMVAHLERYETLEDEESRFVYALDKFLSDLNIFEDDGRTNLELGITFEATIAYKRPRIAKHPIVHEMYEKFIAFCAQRPELHYQGTAAE